MYGMDDHNEFRNEEEFDKVPENQYRSDADTDDQYNAPRWQPDPQKYNTGNYSPKEPKKSSKKWIATLVAVLAVLVAAAVILVVVKPDLFGRSQSRSIAVQETGASEADDTEIEAAETAAAAENSDDNNVVWTDIETAEMPTSGVVITDVSDVVDEVFPAVVSITSRTIINNSDYYNFFFGHQGSPFGGEGEEEEVDSGIGSGTIIGQNDEELLILTSYHVVEDSSSLAVTFVNGTSIDGVIKASSDETDIAIVSVKLDDIDDETMSAIKTAKLSTREAEMGEGVIVIGNAMGYGMSVTTGIVSAVDRQLTVEGKTLSVIQTDAAINQGNSGGCMLNSKGEIIGISEAKIIVYGVEGMCYAIPISANAELIQDLLKQETPETEETDTAQQAGGAYLGIRGRDITSELAESYDMPQGVYVISVVAGGGAEEAGIVDGDIITALDGQDTTTMSKLQYELTKHKEGDQVEVTVMRESGGKYSQANITVTLTGQIS